MMIASQTPSVEATKETDHLLLAGASISLQDIWTQENKLVLKRGKYFDAAEVDRVFNLLNGVFSSVSEEAFRKEQIIQELRTQVAQKDQTLEQVNRQLSVLQDELLNQPPALDEHLKGHIEKLIGENEALEAHNDRLKNHLIKVLEVLEETIQENERLKKQSVV